MYTTLKNDVVMCWEFEGKKPSRINEACLSCNLGGNKNCGVCVPHFMCALEIVHQPEHWNCIWPNLFISSPINLGGSPPKENLVFTCNLKNKKFTCREEGDMLPSEYLPLGFAHLLRQCPRIEKVPRLSTMLMVHLRNEMLLCQWLLPEPLKWAHSDWVRFLRQFRDIISEINIPNTSRVSVFCRWIQ